MAEIIVEFHPVDFLSGTVGMTDEQVGRYIRLLCLQCKKGHLPKRTMKKICRGHDRIVFEKFIQDKDGNYYNKQMEQSLQNYSLLREKGGPQGGKEIGYSFIEKSSKMKRTKPARTHVPDPVHVPKPPRPRKTTNGRMIVPTLKEVQNYCKYRKNGIDAQSFIDFYAARGWMLTRNVRMRDWQSAICNWENRRKADEKANKKSRTHPVKRTFKKSKRI